MEQCIQRLLVYMLQRAMAHRLQILHHQMVLVGRSRIVLMAELHGLQYHLTRFKQRAIMECCLKQQMEQ
nr:MAG TPA: hypothetical protein [Caudoviricetes sp.]